ncbi:SAVED domain-containing protein [Pseudomonas sp. LjRoot277]|uniref:SAVED domain-containing protein n=1 Tax=Pseudomonas sp. LjRoot277 TaxID=3342307 RepID=UPI003ED0B0BD
MSVPLDAMYDQQLRAALEAWQHSSTSRVVLATEAGGWRFAFFRFDATTSDPQEAITGDFGVLSRDLALQWAGDKQLVAKLEYAVMDDVPHVSVNTELFAALLLASVPAKATKKAVQAFLKQRDALLEDMKRPNLPGEVINWVFARSAGICEFEGCPAELFRDNLGNYGYYGYLAHIVAAKPKGPRGDDHLSAELAQSPSNIMLCCDIHHRLIDKVDPDSFSRERLQGMVATRVNWRTNQAASLSYPIVHALAFIGDIAGRTTTYSQHDGRQALLAAHLTPVSERVAEYLLRDAQGGNDVNDPGYWANFLRVFRAQILHIHTAIRGDGAFGAQAQELAVFPLGNMPAMLLGGWLVGEARRVELFSFRRNPGTWVRPDDSEPAVKFEWTKPPGVKVGSHVLITLEITSEITDAALTAEMLNMSRIRILSTTYGVDVVAPKEAMERFRNTCQEAWAYAVDVLHASEISICTVAPAAAIFALGMKLQSRLHPRIHMFQMAPKALPFHAFTLDRHAISVPPHAPGSVLQLDAC